MVAKECEEKRAKCEQERKTAFRWGFGFISLALIAIVGSSVGWAFKTSGDDSAQGVKISKNSGAIERVETSIRQDIRELRTEQREDLGNISKRLDKVIFILRPKPSVYDPTSGTTPR